MCPCAISRSACCTFLCDQLERARRGVRRCRNEVPSKALRSPSIQPHANSGHHAIVPGDGGLAGGLFEDAHPKLRLTGVVYPQPRVELLRRFKCVVCCIAHELIASGANFTCASGLFRYQPIPRVPPTPSSLHSTPRSAKSLISRSAVSAKHVPIAAYRALLSVPSITRLPALPP